MKTNYMSLEEDDHMVKLVVHYFPAGQRHWASYQEISKSSDQDMALRQIVKGLRNLALLVENNLSKENYGRP